MKSQTHKPLNPDTPLPIPCGPNPGTLNPKPQTSNHLNQEPPEMSRSWRSVKEPLRSLCKYFPFLLSQPLKPWTLHITRGLSTLQHCCEGVVALVGPRKDPYRTTTSLKILTKPKEPSRNSHTLRLRVQACRSFCLPQQIISAANGPAGGKEAPEKAKR